MTHKQYKTLYVDRPLLNGEQLVEWARKAGFDKVLDPSDMHVTIAFSRGVVDWANFKPKTDTLRVLSTDNRSMIPLGDKGAVVLKFSSSRLQSRWKEFVDGGCSWDYPGYQPHITITYNGDTEKVDKTPYNGPLIFGPERFKEVELDWEKKVKET